MNILLLGGRSFVALELARNFGRHGHAVYTAESIPVHPAAWSRYTHKNIRVASPRFAISAFYADLCRIIEEEAIEFLVPTCEETYYVSRLTPALASKYPHLQISSGSIEHIRQLHDKLLCMELCRELEVDSPRTTLIRSTQDLMNARQVFSDCRIIIKPRFSRFGAEVLVIEPTDKLDAIDLAGKEWVCQEYIEGQLLCSYAYVKDGTPTATICYQDPLNKSGEASTVFLPVIHDQASSAIATITQRLNYSGSISFDFIVKKDRPILIECNPRVTSGIHCIANNDLHALLYSNKSLTIPAAPAQIRLATIMRHRKWLTAFSDAMFRWHDPLPALSYMWLAFYFLQTSRHTGSSFTAATTYDIEWNGDTLA